MGADVSNKFDAAKDKMKYTILVFLTQISFFFNTMREVINTLKLTKKYIQKINNFKIHYLMLLSLTLENNL